MIRRFAIWSLALIAAIVAVSPAQARWSVGVSVGFPLYGRPFCHYPRYCYQPYPFYVPAPVYVQPVTVVEPVPVRVPAMPLAPVPAPAANVARASYGSGRDGDIERYRLQLQHPDPRERAEAVMQLGRLRASEHVGSLSAALSNDRSPLVREAAARGLGLLGSSEAIDSLQRAAQGDDDRDVRKSAGYAADVIRANLSRR